MLFGLVGFSSAKQPFAASTMPRPGSPFPALQLWSVACQVERKPLQLIDLADKINHTLVGRLRAATT
jgi:hypothetical protein